MLEALRSIIGFVLRAPIAVLLLLWPIASEAIARGARSPRRALEIGSALVLLLAALKVGLYLTAATPLDHVAVQIICVSRGWIDGLPLYHPLDAPARYALLYGPLPYLFAGTILALVPSAWGLAAVKLGFVGCFGLAIATIARAAGLTVIDRGQGALRAAIVAGVLSLATGRLAFTARPDALLLLAAAAGLWIAVRARDGAGHYGAQVGVGLLAGLATACKLHGAIYLLPALAVLWVRRGRAAGLTALVAAAGAALAPFTLPGVDLGAHIALLRSATRHGLSPYLLAINAALALFLLVPALIDRDGAPRETRFRRAGLAVALASATIIGGKAGAGPSHLLPLLSAAALDWVGTMTRAPRDGWRRSLAAAWALSLVVLLAAGLWFERPELEQAFDRDEAEELRALGTELAAEGPVQLAPADAPNSVRLAGLAPWLVIPGGPYDFDLASLSDLSAAGVPLAASARERLRGCATRHWLVPRGSAPFSARSLYPPHEPLFDDGFRGVFSAAFTRTRSTPRFDVWSCKPQR